ncbi:RraA family protein [Endozoicomonas elysicola]|uniref:Putative 4-hydroxy-4-methyl-2-oxoglutarate aldolase n=1 Tax=Endozoicomonas elysicola TaxID=305900 RepID=A0A081KBF1_9GAMM|nr:RraA family protein [Endozoicomonas elysicola]KEI71477.1 dimethylmenaquinone methyltransferase [Endozoicomonas elysicola]
MHAYWQDDDQLFQMARTELFTALVGDIMDDLGYTTQFLPPEIKVQNEKHIIIGRAMTVLETDVVQVPADSSVNNPVTAKDFGLMFEALDSLKKNEVYICSGSSPTYALWGGLMSTRAKYLQAAGAVVNGYCRDIREINALGFPIASMGSYAQDQKVRGKVMDYGVPILFGAVRVNPGDIVFADIDGTVIIPKAIEEKVFMGAFEKARAEKRVLNALKEGMSTVEAYTTFGVM